MSADVFSPPLLLRSPHVQTFVQSWLGSTALPDGEAVRFTAPDGEPLVGVAHWQPGARARAAAALLLHGIEGDGEAPYMRRTAARLLARGWHVIRLDLRGCGRGEALTPTLLHGGRSDDVAAVLTALADDVQHIVALGFSLGGALLLRLLGERGAVPGLVAAAAISPPLNPAAIQVHLDRTASAPYRRYFLAIMAARLRRRVRQFPAHLPDRDYRCATMREYDDRVTAPLAGFADADDYYRRADALPLLPAIATPTLLLHAQDDPLVPFSGFSTLARAAHPHVRGEFPRHGGHLGFYDPRLGADAHWAEARATSFLGEALAAAHGA